MENKILTDQGLDLIFRQARTVNTWKNQPVADDLLQKVYDLMKMGPTGANSCPLRIVFVKTLEAKARLKQVLSPGNIDKTMAAPVTAIFARDMQFYDHLPFLFPHTDARSWFAGNDAAIQHTSFLNASLQAGYFIMAARSLGLDCGPMSGFNQQKLDEEFFPEGRFKSLALCNLGYGDLSAVHPRHPRLSFDEVCRFA